MRSFGGARLNPDNDDIHLLGEKDNPSY